MPLKDSIQVDISPISGINPGAIYLKDIFLFKNANFYDYVYKIKFIGLNATTTPKKVLLQIFNEDKKIWNDPGIEIEVRNPENTEKEINVGKEVGGEFLGKVKYRILSIQENDKKVELYNSTGPEITVNFKNEKFEKTGEDSYSYSVDARSSLDWVDLYLFYKDELATSWNYYYELQTYRNQQVNGTNTNKWRTISWDNAPRFDMVEFAL